MPGADPAGWVRTGDVAQAILFLCSDEARGVSGATLPLGGGR
jgi:NAD(P)-dependent dehydrogenase (short-subunit alcohol dehydrogenase family)